MRSSSLKSRAPIFTDIDVIEVELTANEQAQCLSSRLLSRTIRSARVGKVRLSYESGRTSSGDRVIPESISKLAPAGKSFGFDTIWEVTRLRYHECRQRKEIQAALPFPISTGSVSNLSCEGLAYFTRCQLDAAKRLGERFRDDAFILHLDGTNEGGQYVHYRCIDNRTGIVVYSKKISSENSVDIAIILREVIRLYGCPHAVVSDMSSSVRKAVIEVFGENFPHVICQFHFLRDVGKELLGDKHENLRKSISKASIHHKLKRYKYKIGELILNSNGETLNDFIKVGELINWTLDYCDELSGCGFPFDQKWRCFYERISICHDTICQMYKSRTKKASKAWKELTYIKRSLSSLISCKHAPRRYNELNRRNTLFEELRDVFHCEQDENLGHAPLSRNHKAESKSIDASEVQRKLEDIISRIKGEDEPSEGERIILKHVEKYLPFLAVELTVNGKEMPLPRTNNVSELNFRETKRCIRRTIGKKNLAKTMDLLPAEVAYIRNIDNEKYMKIVFGESEVYDMFATVELDKFTKSYDQIKKTMPEYLVGKPIRHKAFIKNFQQHFIAS